MNGNGKGKAGGRPCAGCVGKADNKNPKGQLPGGSDSNAGYECDRNHGIGRTNPAHTGCLATSTATSTPPPSSTPPSTGSSSRTPPGGGSSSTSTGGFGTSGSTGPAPSSSSSHRVLGSATSTPGSGANLASTGASIGRAVVFGLAVIALGGGLLLVRRRGARGRHQ